MVVVVVVVVVVGSPYVYIQVCVVGPQEHCGGGGGRPTSTYKFVW